MAANIEASYLELGGSPALGMPNASRRSQLKRDMRTNVEAGNPPLYNVRVRTLGELLWIMLAEGWNGGLTDKAVRWSRHTAWFSKRYMRRRLIEDLPPANLQGIDLEGVDLRCINLRAALLQDADLRDANLSGASLRDSNISGTLFTDAVLIDTELVSETRAIELDRQRMVNDSASPYKGVELESRHELLWIYRRESWSGTPKIGTNTRPNLRAIKLSKVDLAGHDLTGADLTGADIIDGNSAVRLRESVQRNLANGKPPYDGTKIESRNELIWVMRENKWSGDPELPGDCERPNLAGADMENARLQRADLEGANLRRARLTSADMTGAKMGSVDFRLGLAPFALFRLTEVRGGRLDRAEFNLADFYRANLFGARFREAKLVGATMNSANLSFANLHGADCREADLSGSDVRGAKVDAATSFIDVSLSRDTRLGDIVWFGTPLTQVRWEQARTLGDELDIAGTVGEERARAYRDATRAYRGMWTTLRQQGLYSAASKYRLREKRLERRFMRERGQLLSYLSSLRADVVAGYGEQPWKAFFAFLLVIAFYGFLYFAATNVAGFADVANGSRKLSIIDSMLLSLTIFQGHAQTMGTLVTVLGATETILGGYILLAFTVLNTRRLLGQPG
jgi:uncharacterized protein YjbI with pentapeptide repeats